MLRKLEPCPLRFWRSTEGTTTLTCNRKVITVEDCLKCQVDEEMRAATTACQSLKPPKNTRIIILVAMIEGGAR